MEKLQNRGVDSVLFLVEKGKPVEVAPQIHKYLFAQFYNPELTAQNPEAFYIYYDQFLNELLPMDSQEGHQSPDTELEISFYRPKSWPFDLSEVIVLVIGLFCIFVGSVWGAKLVDDLQISSLSSCTSELSIGPREDSPEEGALTDDNNVPPVAEPTAVKNNQPVTFSQQLTSVAVAVVMIVIILLVSFFLRWDFNDLFLGRLLFSIVCRLVLQYFCNARWNALHCEMYYCRFLFRESKSPQFIHALL